MLDTLFFLSRIIKNGEQEDRIWLLPYFFIVKQEVSMKQEKRKKTERRRVKRRKKLTEKEFRKVIEGGKVSTADKRAYGKRRKTKRRKRQMGI